ncbi:MAG: TRAP transporter TatT component family protein [Kiritimatiellia bacterium]
MADNLALSLQRQTDLQLVEDRVPALILLLDGLVLSAPENTGLRLAAAGGLHLLRRVTFSDPDDKARAAELFGRAKTYALDVLGRNKRFKAALDDPRADFDAAVKNFRKRDVPALYAAATAWTGWIISNSGSVAATADLSRAMALMQRVVDLDRGLPGRCGHVFRHLPLHPPARRQPGCGPGRERTGAPSGTPARTIFCPRSPGRVLRAHSFDREAARPHAGEQWSPAPAPPGIRPDERRGPGR